MTRNLEKELDNKDDWSLLILHYLGLDHIGHVSGPFSPDIGPKLKEMDEIIGQIHAEIRVWVSSTLYLFSCVNSASFIVDKTKDSTFRTAMVYQQFLWSAATMG